MALNGLYGMQACYLITHSNQAFSASPGSPLHAGSHPSRGLQPHQGTSCLLLCPFPLRTSPPHTMSVEKEGSIQIDDAVAIHDLNELGYEQELVRVSDPLIRISSPAAC